jgi:hypothetical protein
MIVPATRSSRAGAASRRPIAVICPVASTNRQAAPDLTHPGQLTAMTAQHAQRQGKAVARNVAATLGHRTRKPCKHRDLGFVVDLGGWLAVANPLHIPMSGPPANILTRSRAHRHLLPDRRTAPQPQPSSSTPAGHGCH